MANRSLLTTRTPVPRRFAISPSWLGKTVWDLDVDGVLSIPIAGQYTITPVATFTALVKMWGGGGSPAYLDAHYSGGAGGYAQGIITFTVSTPYGIIIGGVGDYAAYGNANPYGAGGSTVSYPTVSYPGGAGGGYSQIYIFGSGPPANPAILLAGGGGGAGWGALGGAGGGAIGLAGTTYGTAEGGQPGTQVGPGRGGNGATPGNGGSPAHGAGGAGASASLVATVSSGGGGGGWFGGGSGGIGTNDVYGGSAGGGGGSGYFDPAYVQSPYLEAGYAPTTWPTFKGKPGNFADVMRGSSGQPAGYDNDVYAQADAGRVILI